MPKKQTRKSSKSKTRIDDSIIDFAQVIDSLDKINPDAKPISYETGFQTSLIRQIVVFDDGSHLYHYADGVDIASNRVGFALVVGKFVSVMEKDGDPLYTYENEVEELLQIFAGPDRDELGVATATLFNLEREASFQISGQYSTKEMQEEGQRNLKRIELEWGAISARTQVLESLFLLYCAHRDLGERFTLSSYRPLREVTLYTARESVRKMLTRKGNASSIIGLCIDYLSNHKIKGKPNYTPKDLANYIGVVKHQGGR